MAGFTHLLSALQFRDCTVRRSLVVHMLTCGPGPTRRLTPLLIWGFGDRRVRGTDARASECRFHRCDVACQHIPCARVSATQRRSRT